MASLEAEIKACAERDKRLTESLLLAAATLNCLGQQQEPGGHKIVAIRAIEFGANIQRVATHLAIPEERVREIVRTFLAQSETPDSPVIRIAFAPDSFYPL